MTQSFIKTALGILFLCPALYAQAPDLCEDSSFDTITRTQDGSTYVFKGNYYWKIVNSRIADGYPRLIADYWGGLQGELDASLRMPDGKTVFFKGHQYWKFTNNVMESGYPKHINQRFHGIPSNLDAAITWSGNNKLYFFKGDQYWGYDPDSVTPVSSTYYPKPISAWNGLPNDMNAGFVWENGISYFFKDQGYYRYDDNANAVSNDYNPYPVPTGRAWFSCPIARR